MASQFRHASSDFRPIIVSWHKILTDNRDERSARQLAGQLHDDRTSLQRGVRCIDIHADEPTSLAGIGLKSENRSS